MIIYKGFKLNPRLPVIFHDFLKRWNFFITVGFKRKLFNLLEMNSSGYGLLFVGT